MGANDIGKRENVSPEAGKDLLVGGRPKEKRPWTGDPEAGWWILGFLGLILFLMGLVDVLLNLYPPGYESVEWKFGTSTRMLTTLPLPTVGFAGIAAWGFARGGKKARIVIAMASLSLMALVAAVYLLFLWNVPVVWSAVEGPQRPAVIRTILRTLVMGIGFGIAYLTLGISFIRTLTPRTRS